MSTDRLPLAAAVVALVLLVAGSLAPAAAGLQRAAAVGGLLRAMRAQPGPVVNRPFPCAAAPLLTEASRSLAREAQLRLETLALTPDQRTNLLGNTHCLLGESEAAFSLYTAAGSSPDGLVQQAVMLNQRGQSELSAQRLDEAGLDGGKAVELLAVVVRDLPGLDWRPHLRQLAGQYPQNDQVWRLWMLIGSNLDQREQYNPAHEWYQAGLALQEAAQVSTYRSSLYLRDGRYYQTRIEPRDPETALEYYNLALTVGEYFYPTELAVAHFYRGEVYRTLKDTYTPAQALLEFEQALAIQPENYWVNLGIGHLYLHDLSDPTRAEAYYTQALALQPDLPYAYYYLGELYRLGGDHVQAEAWYRQALAAQPDYQPAQDRLQALQENP